MEPKALKLRGKEIGAREIETIKKVLASYPVAKRSALSRHVCQELGWNQPNGKPQDVACREILRHLEKCGFIDLPAPQSGSGNRPKKEIVSPGALWTPVEIHGSVETLRPVTIRRVENQSEANRFAELMNHHHYLGYQWTVGRSVKYLFEMGHEVIGGMSWGSGSWKVGSRDKWIGWDAETREKNLSGIACNLRFLIAPWVKVKNLASHLLGRTVKRLPEDWRRLYGVELYALETFVDPSRFRGTCYKAANWIFLGQTKGSGKRGASYYKHGQVKDVYGMAITKDWREKLCMK